MDIKRAITKREALEIVLKIDPETVVDDNWWGYFMTDMRKLIALLILFNCSDYQEFLDLYEGEIIDDLIEDLIINRV